MRVRLADTGLLDDLAARLRGRGFLIGRIDRQVLEAHPLNRVSERHDRRQLIEQVDRWLEAHPHAQPEIE